MKLHNTKRSIVSSVIYNQENDEYTLQTNANDTWWSSDSVSFVHDSYSLPYGECSCLTLEASLESFDEFDSHASAGLMIRSSLNGSSQNASLVVRRNVVFLTYRIFEGKSSHAQRIDMPLSYVFPVKLKLSLQGNVLLGSFLNGDQNEWAHFKPIEIEMGVEVLAVIRI